MKHDSLFPIPDEGRETWLFLLIQRSVSDSSTASWAAGIGHVGRLLERWSTQQATPECALQSLCELLGEYQYEGVTLVTVDGRSLRELRTWLLDSEATTNPTLRGYAHLSVNGLVSDHFLTEHMQHSTEYPDPPTEDAIEELWESFTAIVPLVPADELSGTNL
jgi:hypothetical protein